MLTFRQLREKCWVGYTQRGMKKKGNKMVPNCVKNTNEEQRIPRKPGQPANSKKHSDLYTDENPKGTIQGLKFATAEDAKASVSKIRNSGKSHAHKIQAAVAMEQRAKAAGKTEAASVYRKFINSIKKTNEAQLDEVSSSRTDENFADGRNPQDKGDMVRHGLKDKSISQLKAIRSSNSATPRQKQLAHWRINMTLGNKK